VIDAVPVVAIEPETGRRQRLTRAQVFFTLDGFVHKMDLAAVAIELDLVEPALADGALSIEVANAGSMKPG
jgi:hypothetical protein